MILRDVVLDFLYEHYEHIDGFSFQAIYNRWSKLQSEVDSFSGMTAHRLSVLLAMMIERGELEQPRFSWYRLTTKKWLLMTDVKQRCLISSTSSQGTAPSGSRYTTRSAERSLLI